MEESLKSKLHIIIVVCLVVILALAAYFYKHHLNSETNTPAKAVATIVPLATSKAAVWHEEVNIIGTLAAKRGITLKAEVPGRVTAVFVQSGEHVKKDAKLVQINPKIYKAELKQAQANYALSLHNFKRMKALLVTHAISKSKYDQALFQMNADKAAVEHAQAELNLTTIYAPFAGRFGLKRAFIGDYLATGDTVANLQSDRDLRVDFSIPGRYSHQIQLGSTVSYVVSARPNTTFSGTVYAINTKLNEHTRTLDVRATINATDLVPNAFAEVTLKLDKAYPVITIPQTAVVKSIYGDFVYLVKNEKAVKTIVHQKARRGTMMGIDKGLSSGDIVVSGGQNKIHDGSWVTNKGALSTKGEKMLLHPNA
jgi:membrane fusion protein, multidrug efflux system